MQLFNIAHYRSMATSSYHGNQNADSVAMENNICIEACTEIPAVQFDLHWLHSVELHRLQSVLGDFI